MKSLTDERKVEPLEAGCVSKAFAEEAVVLKQWSCATICLLSARDTYFFLGTRGGGGCHSLGIFLFWPVQGNITGMSCLPFFFATCKMHAAYSTVTIYFVWGWCILMSHSLRSLALP